MSHAHDDAEPVAITDDSPRDDDPTTTDAFAVGQDEQIAEFGELPADEYDEPDDLLVIDEDPPR